MAGKHTIRLRGPWELWLVPRDAAGQRREALGRFAAPDGLAERLPPEYRGVVRLERGFQRPTGLDSASRVRLWIATNRRGQLVVNDQTLGDVEGGEHLFDLTSLLAARNRICLEMIIDDQCASPPPRCDARLEISET
jgi:hypothetical protein